MYCGNCGKQINDGAPFCKYCGAKQNSRPSGAQTPNYGPNGAQTPNYGPNYVSQSNCTAGAGPAPNYGTGYNPASDYGASGNTSQGYSQGYQQNYQQPYQGSQMGAYGAPGGSHAAGTAVSYGARAAGAAVRGGQKAARSAVTIKLLALIAAALIVIAGLLYFLFFSSKKPEDTIEKLEKAMNDLNQDEMLECFDSQMNDLYSGALGVAGELSGIDLGSWADLASGLGGIMSAAGLTPKVELTVLDVTYTGDDSCIVTVDCYMEYMGERSSETMELPMIKEGREWLISVSAIDASYLMGF